MAKQLTITYDEKEYTLEFNRDSVRLLERAGFDPNLLGSQPVSMLPMLFEGAFRMHHRRLDKDVISRIYKSMKNKDKLLEALAEMYREPIEALFDEPEENEGNAEWGKNF